MQFVAGKSLDKLTSTLNVDDFIYIKKAFPKAEEFELVKKKGIFAYDFLDSLEKLKFDKLPSKEEFFNRLNDKDCTESDYHHAELVWKTFGCTTFQNYHDVYLKTDVVLLADFFEKFRETCMENYGLDAAHYYSAPGLAWDASLKMTGVKLNLFDNEQMYTFLERSIRGGICMITKRHAKANNPYCNDFDPKKMTNWLIYLDANNLYGWAMSQSLPTHGFEWMKEDEIKECFGSFQDILNLPDDADDGYIFEVDLKYSKELHEAHNDYPMAVERLTIDQSMLSPFQKSRFPPSLIKDGQSKLTPNLRDKERYVVHYRNLKFYIQHGLIVTKIHRILCFKQSPWLKKYIDYNTRCRTNGKSSFEKDFYKLMNNAVYGKTNENLRNRVNVEVITNKAIALKRVAKPSFERSQIIRDDLVIIQCKVITLKLNKPVYVGFSILELSKVLMYDFHYNHMVPKYKKNLSLCFTDTDSLLYDVKTENIYDDMKSNYDLYDFSEYPLEHSLFSKENKKVIGKMKDELNSIVLLDFIGLYPKSYSLFYNGTIKDNVNEMQKVKGVKESVKKQHLRHAHFRDTLFNLKTISVAQNIIKSRKHTLSTYHITKSALRAFDTKRWILDDNIHTLAYGHYRTL